MFTKRKKILHKRSSLTNQDGSPKLPHVDNLDYGELAINYAKGVETIAIKNSRNELVTFEAAGDIDAGYFDGISKFIAYGDGTRFSYIINSVSHTGNFGEEIVVPDDVTNMDSMFSNRSNLTTLDLSNFDTSNVTNMDSMFNNCSNLTTLDLSNFDTSNVTSMRFMFNNCSNLTTLDLSNFDTSNVTSMAGMFYVCSNLTSLDVSNFDTSNVTNMDSMFNNCSNLTTLDLSNFDTSKVTNMSGMFLLCKNLTALDVSNFNTSNVEDMAGMFFVCNKLRYITLGENFFKTTQSIPFSGAKNLGLNEDNTDNGWLEHLATVAPQITDGRARTIQLHGNLKNKEWASVHIATLQSKGYTIS